MYRAIFAVFSLCPLIFACGEGTELSGSYGAFELTMENEGTAFTIKHSSGLVLRSARERVVGFRRAAATYEMDVGSFLISEEANSDFVYEGELNNELSEIRVHAEGDNLLLNVSSKNADDNRALLALECDPASSGGFLGFGAQTYDADHRGQIVPVWVSEQGIGKVETDEPSPIWNLVGTRHQSYLAVPMMLAPRAAHSYGLMALTDYRSIWDLCKTEPTRLTIEVWEKTLQLLISPGPRPLEVIEQQTDVVGRIPPAPEWTFGVWMEKIGGRAEVEAEVELIRDAKIPASAIWSEDWRGGYRMGQGDYILEEDWRWDAALYPDLSTMIDGLHARGIKFMTYANTFVVEDVDVWNECLENDYLVKDRRGDPYMFLAPSLEPSGLLELFEPAAYEFTKNELKQTIALGSDGWMADFAEWYPADPKTVRAPNGLDPEAAHHRYPVLWAEVNRQAIEESGNSEIVVFHRSGYLGSQGKAHVIWAGDQRTTFDVDDGLPTIIPIMIGLGATGFPIVTHDIAGYVSATNPPTDKELFFRWTTLGALNPIMRTHHGRSAFDNWRWSSDQETIAHFKRWADFHTKLFPLWMALARDATDSGAPILRSPAIHFPEMLELHAVKDAYLVGDMLYVAPIVTSSVSEREVLMPPGDWYAWADDELIVGGRAITATATMSEIPIYARAGSIVPMLPDGVESLMQNDEVRDLDEVRLERHVRVYLGASRSFREAPGGSYELTGVRPTGRGAMTVTAMGNTKTCPMDQVCIETRNFDPATKFTFDFIW